MSEAFIVLSGGLGNQLFQLALGIALENEAHDIAVRYLWNYMGDSYNRLCAIGRFPKLSHLIGPIDDAKRMAQFREPSGDLWPSLSLDGVVAECRGHEQTALFGCWQDESLFYGHIEAVRKALTLSVPDKAVLTGNELREQNTIAVHVRRAQYGHHGHCKFLYYHDAINSIRAKYGNLPVAVFTDEPMVCQYEFRNLTNAFMVATGDDVTDWYLMKCCSHFIIANSSYSWWAAYLGADKDSEVFAPTPWCRPQPSCDPSKAMADRWHLIENSTQGP